MAFEMPAPQFMNIFPKSTRSELLGGRGMQHAQVFVKVKYGCWRLLVKYIYIFELYKSYYVVVRLRQGNDMCC